MIMRQKIYGSEVDVWSVGCLFAEMALQEAMFMGESEIDQIMRIFRLLGTPKTGHWEEAMQLELF